jgi:hypothetical protein
MSPRHQKVTQPAGTLQQGSYQMVCRDSHLPPLLLLLYSPLLPLLLTLSPLLLLLGWLPRTAGAYRSESQRKATK